MPLLFEYAELEDSHKPDTAATPGILRQRGRDAAARFSASCSRLVHGQVREVGKFKNLDHLERPQYARVPVTLTDGRRAYAFEYIEDDFSSLPLIQSGKWEPNS